MGIRRAVVAGAFYPSDSERLKRLIEDCFTHKLGPGRLPQPSNIKREITSIICPHAGYIYSGPVAAHSYIHLSCEKKPDSIVILGPNHTGMGGPVSMWGQGAWDTPLGRVRVDEDLAISIFESSNIIDMDELAHYREHSIEVQLPFLQYIYGDPLIVPICMGFQDLDTSREVGRSIAKAIDDKNVLLMASTDLTHMEAQHSAKWKDKGVIDRVVSMDEVLLQDWIRKQRVSMCGYGPVSAIIVASRELGSVKAELLAYNTSGDITGDHSAVVGYMAAKISR